MITEGQRYVEFIQDVIISIHENLRELQERRNFAAADELAHIEGKIVAYQETLAILKMSADTCGIPKEDIGL